MQVVHGNPHHQQQIDRTDIPPRTTGPQHGKPAKATSEGLTVVDQVDLSPEAQELLDGVEQLTAHGKSAMSVAHQAKALVAAHASLAGMPLGQVVSGLNHNSPELAALIAGGEGGDAVDEATVPVEGEGTEETAPVDETVVDEVPTDGDESVVEDTPPAEEPVEVVEETPPADETVEVVEETIEAVADEVVEEPAPEAGEAEDVTPLDEAPVLAPIDTEAELLEAIDAAGDPISVDQTV
ncbi:MAG: hypothetical protein R3229_13750 [Alphaproteobacteria bacterium]|nr:hypothetical protein [Alphaproteobacteria bacterium]